METIVKYVGGSLDGYRQVCFFAEIPALIQHVDEVFQRTELYRRNNVGDYVLENSRPAQPAELEPEAFLIDPSRLPAEIREFMRFQSPPWPWEGLDGNLLESICKLSEVEFLVRKPDGTIKFVKKEKWTGPAARLVDHQEIVGCSFSSGARWIKGKLHRDQPEKEPV